VAMNPRNTGAQTAVQQQLQAVQCHSVQGPQKAVGSSRHMCARKYS
jgi:hypothetical protein